jgi:hypothetical protein
LLTSEAAARSLRHELQLDPFAPLFVGGEALPKFHVSPESAQRPASRRSSFVFNGYGLVAPPMFD